ncbi:MAG: MarR family winged helix-turn-helix transcriptional regulator [Lachnospiraceae bacterium]
MEEQQRKLFQIIQLFKKLNLTQILPQISHGEFAVLRTIINGKAESGRPIKVSYITEKLDTHAPSVSRNLKALEREGYIVRKVDPDNRRNTYVDVTDKGEALYVDTKNKMNDLLSDIYARMGADSMEHLSQELLRFYTIAESEIEKRIEKMERNKE